MTVDNNAEAAAAVGGAISEESLSRLKLTSNSEAAALAVAAIENSVGTTGDSYDNALAETVIGLFKTEVIRPRGPWKGVDSVELATLDWVDWFNNQRLLEPLGYIPPAEFEQAHYAQKAAA